MSNILDNCNSPYNTPNSMGLETSEDRECAYYIQNARDCPSIQPRVFTSILENIDTEKEMDFLEEEILCNELMRVLQNTGYENVYMTPPHSCSSRVSPPSLVRNRPMSNIWVENVDGSVTNLNGDLLPKPIELFSEIDEETENIIALEEGIARGHVNVRKPYK